MPVFSLCFDPLSCLHRAPSPAPAVGVPMLGSGPSASHSSRRAPSGAPLPGPNWSARIMAVWKPLVRNHDRLGKRAAAKRRRARVAQCRGGSGSTQSLLVDPKELEQALARDAVDDAATV